MIIRKFIMKNIFIITSTLLISGCSSWSVSKQQPQWPWTGGKIEKKCSDGTQYTDGCEIKPTSQMDAELAYSRALNYCIDTYNYYENRISSSKGMSGGLATLGTLFGIAGTAATGNTAKFLSGFSGSTNAFQAAASDLLSTTSTLGSLAYINDLSNIFNTTILDNIEKRSYDKAVFNAMKMASQCRYSSSIVQNEMVNSSFTITDKLNEQAKVKENENKILELMKQIDDLKQAKDRNANQTEINKQMESILSKLTELNSNNNSLNVNLATSLPAETKEATTIPTQNQQ